VQANNILSLLRTHSCFHNLPKDVRTLLHTRSKVAVSKIEPSEYIYFDVETSIFRILSHFSIELLPNELEIDFNTDSCYLDRSGSIHIWPIQCRLLNIRHTRPIVVGIYRDLTKPNDPDLFFEQFVTDKKNIVKRRCILPW